MKHWVSPLEDSVRQLPLQERGIREVSLIPKKAITGKRGHGCNERENILSARERSHRYEFCGQSFEPSNSTSEN